MADRDPGGVETTDQATPSRPAVVDDVADLPGIVPVLPEDAIPSIDDPVLAAADAADLPDDEPVVGVEVAGEARAYPLRILNWHEIVNDEVGGRPLAVTWCPLCGTGLAFSRRVGDRVLTFGVSGNLFKNDLVMVDRETRSYWVQLEGRAVAGPLAGERLELVATDVAPWGAWRVLHPDARVLVPPDAPASYGDHAIDYGADPHPEYATDDRDMRFPVAHRDDRLRAKAVVAGVLPVDGGPLAYPLDALPDPGVAVDRDAGLLVVRLAGAVRGFRLPEGPAADAEDTDREGARWTLEDADLLAPDGARFDPLTGEAVAGRDAGGDADLAPVDLRLAYWFGWADFFPDTALGRPGRAGTNA